MTPTDYTQEMEDERWSGSLHPDTGYSALFTSGLLRTHSHASLTPPPPIRTFSSLTPPRSLLPRAIPTPKLSPWKSQSQSPKKNPTRRLPSSPSKNRPAQPADKALSDVMNKLRLYAGGLSPSKPTLSPVKQSRWSSSSEESMATSGNSHKPRKSGESTMSRVTIGTLKSKKSTWSLKSRRSEDGDRPIIEEIVPPMPEWKGVPVIPSAGRKVDMPVTPGRGRRVVEGLARRLGLTPKKKNILPTPSKPIIGSETYPQFLSPAPPLPTRPPASQHTQPPLDPNLPRPTERPIPRKSSLSTLRSLAKKTSTGTLRSVKSIYSGSQTPELPLPPFTSTSGVSMSPITPRRTAIPRKSSMGPISIGQPKSSRVEFCPTLFDSLPRRAPKTPDRLENGIEGEGEEGGMEVDEIITFSSPSFPFPSTRYSENSPKTPITSKSQMEITPPSNPTVPLESPDLSTPRQISSSEREMEMDMDGESNFHEFLTSTPVSQRPSNSPEVDSPSTYRGTPPLTVKVQNLGMKGKSRSKSRLMDLLPSYNRYLGQSGSVSPPEGRDMEKEKKKGKENKMGKPKSFSNASTPGLKNGLPIPIPIPLPSQSSGKTSSLAQKLRLGSSTTPLTRNPLSTLPLPQSNTVSKTSYTYRSGAVSRGGDMKGVYQNQDEGKGKEEVIRPSTSMGHNLHSNPISHSIPFPTPNPLSTTTIQTTKSVRRRKVPDFSRPMSCQDLSFDISNVSVHHLEPTDKSVEVDPLDIYTGPSPPLGSPISPLSPTSNATPTSYPINSDSVISTERDMEIEIERPNSVLIGHERMNSNSSLMTAETHHTGLTSTSGISGTSGWELERYLRDVESEDGIGEVEERMDVDLPARAHGYEGGVGGGGYRRGHGVIQEAKYGIRI